jgi:uncharacterized damage-inducible protein DinB
MIDTLRDMFAHQAWADAEHWRTLEQTAGALDDPAIRQRLHHIHLVQRAYLSLVRGERVRPTKLEDFVSMAELKAHARKYHEMAGQYLSSLTAEQLSALLAIPWLRHSPGRVTVGQALYQTAMHSHYHRGQNATRIRELGGNPPFTDLILWYLNEKPSPAWGDM